MHCSSHTQNRNISSFLSIFNIIAAQNIRSTLCSGKKQHNIFPEMTSIIVQVDDLLSVQEFLEIFGFNRVTHTSSMVELKVAVYILLL